MPEQITMSVEDALALADEVSPCPATAHQALLALKHEVLFRWEQRTALSLRLQDLRHELVRAGIDDMSPLYEAFHSLTSTAEGWMHPSTLNEAVASHLSALKRRLAEAEVVPKTLALGLAVADRAVRSEVELYAHGFEVDCHPVYDTTRVHEVGGEAEDLDIIKAAVAYIEARGDALPFVMKRQIDAPHLVRFEEKAA